MAKYKICYSGFAFIEADDEEEAKEIYHDDCGGIPYKEETIEEIEEVDEFVVHF